MSAPLTFPNSALVALLADADAKWPTGVRTLYEEVTGRGFWIVGDEGIYLMHNAKLDMDGPNPVVVYANECNPKTLPFDTWWSAKDATWGGDDGCEFIAEAELRPLIERGCDLVFEFSGDQMAILTIERTKQ